MDALEFIRTEYARLDRLCGVDTSGIKISISRRMTRQLGCFTVKKTGFREELSIKIAERILSDEALFLDVIRHEYAHALVHIRHPRRKHNHDGVWKAACLEVGCEPKATKRPEQIAAPQSTRAYKYSVTCRCCGSESKYKNEGSVVKILLGKKRGRVVCRKCGSSKFSLNKLV